VIARSPTKKGRPRHHSPFAGKMPFA
jgi:hypothetical protein